MASDLIAMASNLHSHVGKMCLFVCLFFCFIELMCNTSATLVVDWGSPLSQSDSLR